MAGRALQLVHAERALPLLAGAGAPGGIADCVSVAAGTQLVDAGAVHAHRCPRLRARSRYPSGEPACEYRRGGPATLGERRTSFRALVALSRASLAARACSSR